MSNLEKYLKKLLAFEGGLSDYKSDRGGLTNMGITLKSWQRMGYDKDGDGDVDPDDLMRLTQHDVAKILRYFYWNRWKADEIEDQSLAEMLVDWLWCSGKWGIIIPQRILGVEPDGFVGRKTIIAVNQADPLIFHQKLFEHRLKFIEQIILRDPTQKKFESGWRNRIVQLGIRS